MITLSGILRLICALTTTAVARKKGSTPVVLFFYFSLLPGVHILVLCSKHYVSLICSIKWI